MIRYPKDYNPIKEYWELIESGQEVVGKKIYKVFKEVNRRLNDNNSQYYYSNARANHFIEFCENYCKHSKGKMAGKPVILELWEKAICATIFGFIDIEGNRQIREAVLIIGKKNGKSLIASCVGLYMQIGDNEGGSEVYAVATMKDQAKIVWGEAKRMVNKSPTLKKRIKTLVGEMVSDFNDGIFKPLASNVDSLDGKNVHCTIMDEIHQWKNGIALYDIMADGVTAREQPLIFITSTAGTIREDLYDTKYDEAESIINGYEMEDGIKDDRFIGFIYEIDSKKEWTDERCWKKSNPGLGTIKNIETLRHKVEKAKTNPALVKNLVCKEFNIRETSSETWLSFEVLNNTATYSLEELKPRYCVAGIDLGATTDLTCATIIFNVPNDDTLYVKQMYWLPGDLLEKRTADDKIPYTTWLAQGLLRVSEGNKVNYKDVTNWLLEVQNEMGIYIYKIGYDNWSSTYLIDELHAHFGKYATEAVIQGAKTFSNPLKRVAVELESKKINYNNSPIFKWNLSNAAVSVDRNDNIALIKTSNQKKRIDGVASFMDAFIAYERFYNDYINML